MSSIKLSRTNLTAYLGIIIYKIILDLSYYCVIGPDFAYSGFENEFSELKLVISYIILLITAPFIVSLYNKFNHPVYSYVILFLVLLSFIPNLSFIVFNNVSFHYLFLLGSYWALFLLSTKFIPFFKPISIKFASKEFPVYAYLLILSSAVLIISFVYTGFRLHFNLMDVYDLRNEASEYGYPSIFGYLLPAAGTLLPLLLLYFFEKKRLFVSSFIILVILLNFGIAGHKTVLVSLIITLLFYFFYHKNIIKYVTWILSGFGFLGILEYVLGGTSFLLGLIFRRVLFMPAYLNIQYADYFSNHVPDYFRQGILKNFGFVSPYKRPIAVIIGDTYIGPDCNANNGLFSDALTNFGLVGVFIFPIAIVIIIKIIDSLSKGIPSKMLIIPAMMMAISFLSTSFMTALFTGGLLLTMFLFYVFPRKNPL